MYNIEIKVNFQNKSTKISYWVSFFYLSQAWVSILRDIQVQT